MIGGEEVADMGKHNTQNGKPLYLLGKGQRGIVVLLHVGRYENETEDNTEDPRLVDRITDEYLHKYRAPTVYTRLRSDGNDRGRSTEDRVRVVYEPGRDRCTSHHIVTREP